MWKILKYLPRKALSRFVGFLVHLEGPEAITQFLIKTFAAFYKINLHEMEKPISAYKSLGDFFVRRLKPGLRPLATSSVVHCADSEILEHGVIPDGGWCLQAKGQQYRVIDFLKDADWYKKWEGGYYINYYLCPTDYHRVHSPSDGFIQKIKYVSGDLWPVHKAALKEIPALYPQNERVIMEFATPHGPMAAVLVGATNVGSIEISCLTGFKGNAGKKDFTKDFELGGVEVKKGDELGCFRMGSTVIVFFSKEVTKKLGAQPKLPQFVKVNSGLV